MEENNGDGLHQSNRPLWSTFYVPGTLLGSLHTLLPLLSATSLGGGTYYYPHCVDAGTEAQRS